MARKKEKLSVKKLKLTKQHGRRVVSATLAILIFASVGVYLLTASRAAVPTTKMKMGVYVGNGAHVGGFENMTGHPVQVISNYLDLRYAASTINDYMSNQGVASWLRADPNRVYLLGVNPLLGEAYNFESGSAEAGMRELANAIVGYGVSSQVVIRFGYEMTGNWMPWGVQTYGDNTGPRYAAMWRRAHDAANAIYPFKWDWCPMIWNNATNASLEEFYPGDNYVDYVGNDTYDAYAGGTPEQRWPDILERLQNQVNFANAHGKQPVQDEYALWDPSGEQGGGDDPYYITHFLDYTAAHNYAWAVYFNVPDGSVDTTLDQNPNGLNAYKNWWASYDAGGGPVPTPPPTPTPTSSVDLVVTGITTNPTSPVAGQPVTMKATVKNQGTGASPAGTILGVRFDVNGTTTWSDTNTSSLAAGASVTLTANGGPAGATWTPATTGTISATATVDDVNRIPESNESNNALTANVVVGTGTPVTTPDLIVTDITWNPTIPIAPQAVTFTAVVKNQGTGPTPAGTILGVAFSVDGVKYNWSDSSTTALAAGASRTLTANGGASSATWPASTGNHTVEAWVDDAGRITSESNTANNKLTKALSVPPPNPTPTPTFKAEDINQDGIINLLDFSILAANFGKSSGLTNARADINLDGTVNLLDFSLLSGKFGT